MTTCSPAITPAMEAGIAYLQETYGADWYERISTDILDIDHPSSCLLAQLDPQYRFHYKSIDWEVARGFVTPLAEYDFAVLYAEGKITCTAEEAFNDHVSVCNALWKNYIFYMRGLL